MFATRLIKRLQLLPDVNVMQPPVQRAIKFIGVGVLNTLFGYGIYAGLIFINLPYILALFIATVCGVIFNYFSFGKIVFNQAGGRTTFVKFILAYGVVYVINALLLMLLTQGNFLNAYMAQAVCVLPNVLLSWLLMNFWVYKKD